MKAVFVAAIAFFCAAEAAAAPDVDSFAKKFFGPTLGPGVNYACFARVYDAGHLAKHPRQNVTEMALLARLDAAEPSYYALTLGLRLRKARALRTTSADCSAHGGRDGATIECSAACEGGQVDIKLKDDGSVWLTFPHNGGVWSPTEAGDPVVKPTGLGPDDLLFRLDRASGRACVPLTSDDDAAKALRRQK